MAKSIKSLIPVEDTAVEINEEVEPESTFESPLKNYTSSAFREIETSHVYLPFSKREETALIRQLNPKDCFPSKFNERKERFLTTDNPKFMSLLANIRETKKQLEPALVRIVKGADGKTRYEVIAGVRRRKACDVLDDEWAESGGFSFTAKVVQDMPDLDARMLSSLENKDREETSVWEYAVFLKESKEEGGLYDGKSQAFIADCERISEAALSKLLRIASINPEWIDALGSPNLLSLNDGSTVQRLVQGMTPDLRNEVLEKVSAGRPYKTCREFMTAIQSLCKKSKVVAVATQKGERIQRKGGGDFVVIKQKRNKAGEYKVDIEGASPELIDRLIAFFKKEADVKQ